MPLLPLTPASALPAEPSASLEAQAAFLLGAVASPLPSPEGLSSEGTIEAAAAELPREEPEPAAPLPVFVVYVVQEGDTIGGLAAAHGLSPSSIVWSNPSLESADSLSPGQELRIPPADGIVYDVASGDTLSDIAARFSVDVQAIIDFAGNGLSEGDAIAEGQTIFVPNGTMPDPVATPEPGPLPEPERVPEPPAPEPVATPLPVAPSGDPSELGARAADLARSRIGSPYVAGGAGPSAFDCSGLVYWVYRQLGVPVPRTSWEQYSWATPVDPSQMQPGDIVFFTNTWSGGVSHVGIYAGGGMVVMAVDEGDIVREVALAEGYWSAHFAGAGRPP